MNIDPWQIIGWIILSGITLFIACLFWGVISELINTNSSPLTNWRIKKSQNIDVQEGQVWIDKRRRMMIAYEITTVSDDEICWKTRRTIDDDSGVCWETRHAGHDTPAQWNLRKERMYLGKS